MLPVAVEFAIRNSLYCNSGYIVYEFLILFVYMTNTSTSSKSNQHQQVWVVVSLNTSQQTHAFEKNTPSWAVRTFKRTMWVNLVGI